MPRTWAHWALLVNAVGREFLSLARLELILRLREVEVTDELSVWDPCGHKLRASSQALTHEAWPSFVKAHSQGRTFDQTVSSADRLAVTRTDASTYPRLCLVRSA